jgi:NAD(P)-dependent dehydrogenase (short-subunit alcohol dehydrogenase family)
VHLNGSFLVSRAAATHFREQGRGAFVHMTSTSGLIGNHGQANYAAAKLGIAALSRSIAMDMARFNVRSNCIAPFAATRMIDTIPTDDANQALRVRLMKALGPEKLGPMAVFLASDLAEGVSGQISAVRCNEVFLLSQPRPLRGIHQDDGWTPETMASHALPALRSTMVPLETSRDVFPWEPL